MKNFNIDTIVRQNIRTIKPYSSARDEFKEADKKMIFLDANENPFENGVNRYPDPQQKALKAILAKQKNVSQNQILLGNGSDELLDLLFRTFCEPNKDNIITLPPTYGMYGVLAAINAIENREILLSAEFQPQTETILDVIDVNTKIIFLCSPNNPTGNCFSENSICTLLENFDGLVVIDEAYIDFSDRESWLTKLSNYPNLVIIQTLSKSSGMAGIRLGILYSSTIIVELISKIKPPYNINVLSQAMALDTLSNPEALKTKISMIKEEKKLLLKQLLQVYFIKKIHFSDANFILTTVDDANLRYLQLVEKGIVVRNRSNEPLCTNCLRISIGTSAENQLLINTLKML